MLTYKFSKRVNNEEIVGFSRPFGPALLKVKLPEAIINDFNQDCLDINNNKKEKIDFRDHLAGNVEEEYLISKNILVKYAGWFSEASGKYLHPDPEEYEKNKHKFKIGIANGWYVRQFDGDFNPVHQHTGCQLSCIGFLKLPDDINELWKEEDKDHSPSAGYINFIYGFAGLNCENVCRVKPQVGDFYMFPNWLSHMVYPFRSKFKKPDTKGERRSFSLNICTLNIKEEVKEFRV